MPKFKRQDVKLKAPSGGGSGQNTGLGVLLGMMAAQQKSQMGRERNPNEVTLGRTDPFTGERTATPEGAAFEAKQKQEEKLFEQSAQTAPARAAVRTSLVNLKRLSDTVPAPKPGLQRFIQGAKNAFMGATQQMPQIDEYNDQRESILGQFSRLMAGEKGTLADRDIDRMHKAFPDISYDTEDRRALAWSRFFQTYNEISKQYKSLQNEIGDLNPKELMTPKEIGRSRFLSGVGQFEDLSDDELEGIFEGPIEIKPGVPIVPRPIVEAAIEEYERRELHRKGQTVV